MIRVYKVVDPVDDMLTAFVHDVTAGGICAMPWQDYDGFAVHCVERYKQGMYLHDPRTVAEILAIEGIELVVEE